MAKNDIVIVDNIVKERINSKTPSSDLGEVFEFFAFEQVLKDYDLSVDQIIDGVTDGRNDGGIDGFYIFINGNYLEDVKSFMWPKKSCEIKIYILSAKHHDTFEKALLDDQYSTICELLDLSIETKNFKTQYNDELVSKRDFFVEAYRRTSANLVSMEIDFYYLSRGDSDIVGENVVARANQIKAEIENFFSECDVSYSFFGSSELIKQYRKNKDFKLKLKYSKVLNNSGHNFIALCPIGEYFNFITFSDKKLRRYLFDSNVRAYMGLNRVNDDILESLKTNISIDFWYLNNGITILATGARDLGNYIEIDNAQIVNGLQTSETIFHYFSNYDVRNIDRNILVKVISETSNEIGDSIIKATNNQTAVSVATLHATDKIHRDIEDVMLKNDLFYERRINYYYNQGKELNSIFPPTYSG